ncbi:anion permease [Shigella flexneri]
MKNGCWADGRALVLWIFGGDYIDAAMVGYSVVALMLLLRVVGWDDIVE